MPGVVCHLESYDISSEDVAEEVLADAKDQKISEEGKAASMKKPMARAVGNRAKRAGGRAEALRGSRSPRLRDGEMGKYG
jgi:hypothetical protein